MICTFLDVAEISESGSLGAARLYCSWMLTSILPEMKRGGSGKFLIWRLEMLQNFGRLCSLLSYGVATVGTSHYQLGGFDSLAQTVENTFTTKKKLSGRTMAAGRQTRTRSFTSKQLCGRPVSSGWRMLPLTLAMRINESPQIVQLLSSSQWDAKLWEMESSAHWTPLGKSYAGL